MSSRAHPTGSNYSIEELDSKEWLMLGNCCLDLRNNYATLFDLITKNMDKITRPRYVAARRDVGMLARSHALDCAAAGGFTTSPRIFTDDGYFAYECTYVLLLKLKSLKNLKRLKNMSKSARRARMQSGCCSLSFILYTCKRTHI